MADREPTIRNDAVEWSDFDADEYWKVNYASILPEDMEIIEWASKFLIEACGGGRPRRAVDVGAGANLYPALLMLPWTEQILLADFSRSNVGWLHDQLADQVSPWPWHSFWQEMRKAKGYSSIDRPRERLREACISKPGHAGIEQLSVFDLPKARWDLGTMFFVAESITEDPVEFRAAVAAFTGALTPGAPFAAAFMAGSGGYPVGGTHFPAVAIRPADVQWHLAELGVRELSVDLLDTRLRVRDGWAGMIIATGLASGQ
jgi:hypothetical protein